MPLAHSLHGVEGGTRLAKGKRTVASFRGYPFDLGAFRATRALATHFRSGSTPTLVWHRVARRSREVSLFRAAALANRFRRLPTGGTSTGTCAQRVRLLR